MIVPGHLFERAQNVWDIYFDWQGEKLHERYTARAHELRSLTLPPQDREDKTQRAGIIFERVPQPRIEYRAPSDIEYIFNFCAFHQMVATDSEEATRLMRWILGNEREQRSPEMMIELLDDLHAGFWVDSTQHAATRLAISMGVTNEAPVLAEPRYIVLYRELRASLEEARKAQDLNCWWYHLYRLIPRLELARRHSAAMGEEERTTYHRFFDEVLTDVGSYQSMAMNGWLGGGVRPLSTSLFFSPFGRSRPSDIYPEKTMRFNLPSFWYDEAKNAEPAILRVQETVLKRKVPLADAELAEADPVPKSLDGFSPHLLAALIILWRGGLERI